MSWACLRCQVPDDQQGSMTQSGHNGHMTQMSHNGHNGHQTAVTDWLGDADDWGDGGDDDWGAVTDLNGNGDINGASENVMTQTLPNINHLSISGSSSCSSK